MIDLDEVIPLPEFFTAQWEAPLGEIRAGYEGEVCGKRDAVALRLATWNAALDAAIKMVEHEAFPSELPRFGVATDKLRDMRIEPEKPK